MLELSGDSTNREHDVIIYVILEDEFDHLGTLRAFDLIPKDVAG